MRHTYRLTFTLPQQDSTPRTLHVTGDHFDLRAALGRLTLDNAIRLVDVARVNGSVA